MEPPFNPVDPVNPNPVPESAMYPPVFARDLKPGDGVTLHSYSDAHSYTVVKVTRCSVVVKRDNAVILNGPNSGAKDALVMTVGGFAAHTEGEQRYQYSPNPNGNLMRLVEGKRGLCWQGKKISMGRHEHYDYNF